MIESDLVMCSGDHTVKIIDCETGSCLKVLIGHRRTPWVVSFKSVCLPFALISCVFVLSFFFSIFW